MTQKYNPGRRRSLRTLVCASFASVLPVWAQSSKGSASNRVLTVAQIVDMSNSQIDVSKDFLVGSRTAWQEINAKGGIQGAPVRHLVMEVDGSPTSLRTAVDSLKTETQCVALFGSVGDRTASLLAGLLRREMPELPHVAPWLQNVDAAASTNTFPIFASRQEQIAHAIKSLSVMGITQVGASRFTPMIATQVVPMVNSNVPIVKAYRTALGRLFDEPPTPLSLAGYVAARYTFEVLQGIEGTVTRATALQAFGRRSPVDLGGFRITPDARGQGTAYVTQSMVAADGRLVG